MTPTLGYLGSYAYDARRFDKIATYLEHDVPVLMDSGAFSVAQGTLKIDVQQHTEWAHDWSQRLQGKDVRFFALDVIGDFAASIRNYDYALTNGVDVVPTIHFGTDPDRVGELIDRGASMIALGGLVRYLNTDQSDKAIAWSASVLRRTSAHDIRVHALGATHPHFVSVLPVDSIDSTYWLNPQRWGYQALFDKRLGDWRKFKAGTGDAFAYGSFIRATYNVEPDDVDANTRDIGTELPQWIASRSHDEYCTWIRNRHNNNAVVYLAGGDPKLPLNPQPPARSSKGDQ